MNSIHSIQVNKKHKKIYLSPPHLSGLEMGYLRETLASNWIAPLGPQVDMFEKEVASWHGRSDSVAVSSATAALHLILRCLNVGPGDTVFCSTFTFCGGVNPVRYVGAEPVFIDSEPHSWNMDPELLEKELVWCANRNRLPKAVVVTFLYGQCAYMPAIVDICSAFNVPVIEDAAEALGATCFGDKAGTMGTAGYFSFNGNKLITASSGGLILAQDKIVLRRARFLASQAREPSACYLHKELGYNYGMSNILAAIGRAQFKVLNTRINQARTMFHSYKRLLQDVPGICFMPEPDWSFSTRWLTCITIEENLFGSSSEHVRLKLLQDNIESRPLWKPMHTQPLYHGCRICGGSVSEKLFRTGLCLPSGTAMSAEDIERVSQRVMACYRKRQVTAGNEQGETRAGCRLADRAKR